jgi:hypothetical protein
MTMATRILVVPLSSFLGMAAGFWLASLVCLWREAGRAALLLDVQAALRNWDGWIVVFGTLVGLAVGMGVGLLLPEWVGRRRVVPRGVGVGRGDRGRGDDL